MSAANDHVREARDALRKVQTGRIWFGEAAECLDPIIDAIKALDRLAGLDNATGAKHVDEGPCEACTAASRRRLTLGDVPEEVTFVDEAGNVLPEYGNLTIPPWFALVVLNKARRWRQSIDTTLERMIAQAIRQYVAKRKATA